MPIENLLRGEDRSMCVAIVEVGAEHAYVYQERPATYDGLSKSES